VLSHGLWKYISSAAEKKLWLEEAKHEVDAQVFIPLIPYSIEMPRTSSGVNASGSAESSGRTATVSCRSHVHSSLSLLRIWTLFIPLFLLPLPSSTNVSNMSSSAQTHSLSMQDIDALKSNSDLESSTLPNTDLTSFSSYQHLQSLFPNRSEAVESKYDFSTIETTDDLHTNSLDDGSNIVSAFLQLGQFAFDLFRGVKGFITGQSMTIVLLTFSETSAVASPAPGWDKKSRYLLPARLFTIPEHECPIPASSPSPPSTIRRRPQPVIGLGIGLGLPSSMITYVSALYSEEHCAKWLSSDSDENEEKDILKSVRPASKASKTAKFASATDAPQAPVIDAPKTSYFPASVDALFAPGSLSPEWPEET